jgi:SAM-dependent methyltransferase
MAFPDPRAALANPLIYRISQSAFGAERARRKYAAEYVRARQGDRILDIGCGTGDILRHLPRVEYVGFDLSEEYISHARGQNLPGAEFHQADVNDVDLSDYGSFDVVMSFGVVHHLDDEGAEKLITKAGAALKPAGRVVTIDPVLVTGQARIARWLIERDRGRYVRAPQAYNSLWSGHFSEVRQHIVSNLLRIPYTHCIIESSSPTN